MCVCVRVLLVIDPTVNSDIEYIECLETCRVRQHRHCVEVPDKCGECLSSFVTDVYGVCQPVRHQRAGMYASHTEPNAPFRLQGLMCP